MRNEAKVSIDARQASGSISGIGRYTRNLLDGIAAAHPDFRIVVFLPDPSLLPSAVQRSGVFEIIRLNSHSRLVDQFVLASAARSAGVRLLHCPDAFGPLISHCPALITVHDLIGIVCRDLLRASAKGRWPWLWKNWLRLQCRRAWGIVTVSEHSASDITAILRVPREKIHVIPNAARLPAPGGPPPFPAGDERIILYVGRQDPYKNVPGLIRAFARIRRKLAQRSRLVIVGPEDGRYPQARQEAVRLGLGDSVRFTGYVDDETLAALYRSASVLVFPSLYEGFGLPPLEAMSFGLPVVSSNRSALPEVLGDAALYVDPSDVDAMADATLRVLEDAPLAERLRRAGRSRAAEYSVERVGVEHLRLYERILAGA